MIAEIANLERLRLCAEELKRKRFTPGFDNMDAASAVLWIDINGGQLSRKIINGSYEAMPAVGFHVAKKNGSYRRLARLTAIDTIVQNSILSVINDVCDERFSAHSFAYRKNRGVSQALQRYCELGSEYPFALKLDPISCFDNMDHTILENSLYDMLQEKAVVGLIMLFVKMPLLIDREFIRPQRGIIQGAPLSALLCNIYFDAFDRFLEDQQVPFIRYAADDIILFCNTLKEAQMRQKEIVGYLQEKLSLQENKRKTMIDAPTGIRYLGHRFEINQYGMVALEAESTPSASYYNWYEHKPVNNRRRIDILSDGILRQKDFSLAFESDCQETDIPIAATDIINVYSNVIFDAGFLKKALEYGISINLFDQQHHLIGHFLSSGHLKAPRVTAEQLLIYMDTEKRLYLARTILLASIHNTRLVIRYYRKQRTEDVYSRTLNIIQHLVQEIRSCTDYEKLLLIEARVREAYYQCFDSFIKDKEFRFEQRTRRPPRNEINAMISFGNVVLYNLIAVEINKTALDVRVGFLHATNRRRESLNLDIAEIFKPLIVDRSIFALINMHMIHLEDFSYAENGACYLTENGKRIFLRQFYEKIDSTLTIKEETLSYYQLIKREIFALIRYFRDAEAYKPFKQVR